MNTQTTEKRILHADGSLDVHSCFMTIQGEGPFVGMPAVFLRLAGCNLQCPGCDTEYTAERRLLALADAIHLVERTALETCHLLVITGGEPLRQDLRPLIREMMRSGRHWKVQVETNGTYGYDMMEKGSEILHHPRLTFVCSPKTGRIATSLEALVGAWKYVVQAGKVSAVDGLPTTVLGNSGGQVARPHGSLGFRLDRIYVQPMDEKDERKNRMNTEAAVASCLQFGYRLCLQTHKIAQLP